MRFDAALKASWILACPARRRGDRPAKHALREGGGPGDDGLTLSPRREDGHPLAGRADRDEVVAAVPTGSHASDSDAYGG